ncbi:spermidine synthase [Devosia sp. 2618]|uniref:spermidine synthase n=1 Tax=Devosia sp. 2618 TaxID=3156454 RepID=UPI00339A2B45
MPVKPWTLLDTVSVPGGEADLRLMRRGTEFSIMAGATSLMNSRMSGSEEALASLSWERISKQPKPHMLIGGLGMGFTLRAAQALLPADAKITVAELVPAVVAWARGPMAEVFGESLSDPRVTIREADVGAVLNGEKLFDAILLDVDNGPEGLTRDSNDKLYTVSGLRRTLRALRDGGVLAVWSSHTSAPFTKRLVTAGFAVEEVPVRARGKSGGERHHIWLARKA